MSNTQRNHLLHVLTVKSPLDTKCFSFSELWKPNVQRTHECLIFGQSQTTNNRRRRCFYCVKINPKDIRRSCGQKLVAPAPFAPQACPL